MGFLVLPWYHRKALNENMIRPTIMTALAIILGLLPIMWSQGTGADVMKRIAAPMIGGMVTATILTLLVIPALYLIWRRWELQTQIKA